MTISLIAVGVAIFGLLSGLLVFSVSGSIDDENFMPLIGFVPFFCASMWIAFNAWRAKARRAHMISSLRIQLSEHGDGVVEAAASDFPDIPIWIHQNRIYWAGENDVECQPVDQLLWAYADHFLARPWYQLVIWNRHARATVLPLRKREISPSLDRLRAAAPWLPVGYNVAMKESWNCDHQDLVALIDNHRQSGKTFDVPWAGDGMAGVQVQFGKEVESLTSGMIEQEREELRKALQCWNVEPEQDDSDNE